MSHWNYRVRKTKTDYGEEMFDIVETYYENKEPILCTLLAVQVYGSSIAELRQMLNRMLDCLNKEVLDDPKFDPANKN